MPYCLRNIFIISKYRTKGLYFLSKPIMLRPLYLNIHYLKWVTSTRFLRVLGSVAVFPFLKLFFVVVLFMFSLISLSNTSCHLKDCRLLMLYFVGNSIVLIVVNTYCNLISLMLMLTIKTT